MDKTMADVNAIKKPHHCTNCQKSFASLHLLAQHSRIHSGEKPYSCDYCERRFKQLSHLQQHNRLHTGERPYKCSVVSCGRSFIQLSNLQQHMKIHSNTSSKSPENLFFCVQCGKGYKGQVSLSIHQSKKHAQYANRGPGTENQPIFTCSHCNKQYVNESSYKHHLSQHQNQQTSQPITTTTQLWPCHTCSIVFSNQNGLLSHLEQMKGDPKHRKDFQNISIKTEPDNTFQTSVVNLNEIIVSTLISNGTGNGGTSANNNATIITATKGQQQPGFGVSAELLAQNLLQLNPQT